MNQRMLLKGVARRFLRFKFKSLMMMLGVIVGVFTLTTGLALGSGFKVVVLDYFNKIFLPNSLTVAVRSDVRGAQALDEDDVAALTNAIPGVAGWTPVMTDRRVTLVRDASNQVATVMGTAVQAQSVLGHQTSLGAYFTDAEVSRRARVVVLGETVRSKLFGTESPLGQPLTVGSQVFTITGVLSRIGADPHGGDLDNMVVIPYTTLQQINKQQKFNNLRFLFNDAATINAAVAPITALLRQRHQIQNGQSDDFSVSDSPAGQSQFRQFENLFKILLPIVVAVILVISLLVIASLMLISVKERTAEIGLRKAVGARSEDIERQFLLETLLLALIGGALGNGLSLAVMAYVQNLYRGFGMNITFLPSPAMLLLSLGCAALTGVLAAWLPARRAAALSPVLALR